MQRNLKLKQWTLKLGTGIRGKEFIMLKWDDVDFKNQTFNVYGKNRKYETVFLTDKLTKELLAFWNTVAIDHTKRGTLGLMLKSALIRSGIFKDDTPFF